MRDFVELTCCACGIHFQLEDELLELRKQDGKLFYCPNGHNQRFVNSPADELKGLREKVKEVTAELEEKAREVRELKCRLLAQDKDKSPRSFLDRILNPKSD